MLDSRFTDADENDHHAQDFPDAGEEEDEPGGDVDETGGEWTADALERRAAQIYEDYQGRYRRRFRWLPSDIFADALKYDLQTDADALLGILRTHGDWRPEQDAKLNALHQLLTRTYPEHKVLVFSQFADTVGYLEEELSAKGLENVAGVTGTSAEPTKLARHSVLSATRRETR